MSGWLIAEDRFEEQDIAHLGNKYLSGNGFMGVRGTLDEYKKEQMVSINLAGVYDKHEDKWRESVNAPNPLYTFVMHQNEVYSVPDKEPVIHSQSLDFRNAIHKRVTTFRAKPGNITIESERFVSMDNRHIIGLAFSVRTDFDGEITLYTGIDSDVWDINGPHFINKQLYEKDGILLASCITGEKKINVVTAEGVLSKIPSDMEVVCRDDKILRKFSFDARANQTYIIEKVAFIDWSERGVSQTECVNKLQKALQLGYDELKARHIEAWDRIWDISEVRIDGDDEANMALNYSIYHLNCIAPRFSESMSIPARGLSGQVYKGAIFWDTEMFMFDYFLYTQPKIARTLIKYRIDTLDGARKKAASYGFKGAFFAWESQEGGIDACSDFNVTDVFTGRPMRTYFKDKQVHVTSAIVYALKKYIKNTKDNQILYEGGYELLLESALFYKSILVRRDESELYEIHDVVGPDEYHERVNNNAYTNRMARFVFDTAVEIFVKLRNTDPAEFGRLNQRYDLVNLIPKLEKIKGSLYLQKPSGEEQIIEQFDGYFKLEEVDIETLRTRLLHEKEYWGGALGVATHTRIIKQADVVTMLCMFPDDYSAEIMKKNWDFYEPRTEHGSSLSACMYSLLACRTGNPDAAYPFFLTSAKADLKKGGKQWAGNIYIGGTHPASAGGAWMVAVFGFAGLKVKNNGLAVEGSLPENIKGIEFKVIFRNQLYLVRVGHDKSEIKKI